MLTARDALNLQATRISSFGFETGGGAGQISLTASRIELGGGTRIAAEISGSDFDDNIVVKAQSSIILRGARISTEELGTGIGAGRISISSPTLEMYEGAVITAEVRSEDGAAGDIALEVGRLLLTDGSQIRSNTDTLSDGDIISTIAIHATDSVTITGRNGAGVSSGLFSNTDGSNDAGRITLSVPTLSLQDGAVITTSTTSIGRAGDIVISADNVTLSGDVRVDSSTLGLGSGGTVTIVATELLKMDRSAQLVSRAERFGDGGRISLSAPLIQMVDSARITTRTTGPGRAGPVVVKAEHVLLIGGSRINSDTSGTGAGGNVTITATETATLEHAAVLAETLSTGDAGQITLQSPTVTMGAEALILAQTLGNSEGNAGTITLSTQALILTDGARIASSTRGLGAGGTIAIVATEAVSMVGRGRSGLSSGLISSAVASGNAGLITVDAPTVHLADGGILTTRTSGSGEAGNIVVKADRLRVMSGAQIDSSTGSTGRGGTIIVAATETVTIAGQDRLGAQSRISSDTAGSREAGRIAVSAPVVHLEQMGTITTSTTGLGNAGDIDIKAEDLNLIGQARVDSSARGQETGRAGTLRINAVDVLLERQSAIATEADQSSGGNIVLVARLVQLRDSTMTAEARGVDRMGSNGGNIDVTAEFVVLNKSRVQANAFGGTGGNIEIQASRVFLGDAATCSNQACLDASSERNVDGIVDVQSQVTDLSAELTSLPEGFGSLGALVQRCANRWQRGDVSRFVAQGRDGLPTHPGHVLPTSFLPVRRNMMGETDSAARLSSSYTLGLQQRHLVTTCSW